MFRILRTILNPPKTILITTDSNEIELVGKEKIGKSEEVFRYKFTKSKTKLNTTFTITEKELFKQLDNSFKVL